MLFCLKEWIFNLVSVVNSMVKIRPAREHDTRNVLVQTFAS